MEINYALSRADYIDFQLYVALKSKQVQKNKRNSRIRLPIIYLICGTLLWFLNDVIFGVVFYLVGVLWYFLSPTITNWRYKRHYCRFVDEHFKNRFEKSIQLKISNDFEWIETNDFEGESNFKTSEIEKIVEIKRFIFIKSNSGSYLIIPKYKIENSEQFKQVLTTMATVKNLEIETEPKLDISSQAKTK